VSTRKEPLISSVVSLDPSLALEPSIGMEADR
jgi:hypothetical protein